MEVEEGSAVISSSPSSLSEEELMESSELNMILVGCWIPQRDLDFIEFIRPEMEIGV